MSEHHSIVKLRPYQVRALNQIIAKLNSPEGAALLVGPTGCGKTEIIAGLIDRLPHRARTIVLQDLVDLVRQNGIRIASYLPDRNVVTMAASLPGKFHLPGAAATADVVVGTIDTILASIEYIGAVDVLIIDEAQHAPARSYLECIAQLRDLNPELRIMGATATPERPDFVGLHCVFGDEAAAVITLKELIEGGWLVAPRVLALPLAGLADLIARKIPDDDDARLSAALNLEVVHQEVIRNWVRSGEQRQSVFFCQDVAHSDGLAAAFRDAGVEAESVSYKTPIRKRTTLIRDFAAGQGVKVLTNPILLCEGFDAPPVSCIGLVRWIVSKSPLIQPVGRGLRLYPGKQDCLVLDFMATIERVGDLTAGINLHGRKAPPPIHGHDSIGEGRGPSTVIGYGEATLQPFTVPDIPEVGFVRLPEERPPPREKVRKIVDGKEVISLAEARVRGLDRYFTGKPCARAHLAERHTATTKCVVCAAIDGAAAHLRRMAIPENRSRFNEKHTERYRQRMQDPEYRASLLAKARERIRKRKQQDPEYRAALQEQTNKKRREYRADPEYRARQAAQKRERWKNDPKYRAHQLAYQAERDSKRREDPEYLARARANAARGARERMKDPEYRKRAQARANERRRERMKDPECQAKKREWQNKWLCKRRQDPEYRAKRNEQGRKQRARKKEAERAQEQREGEPT